jgi:hypothetical protein
MGFLRRLFGGDGPESNRGAAIEEAVADAATLDEAERAHELELARFEQERTDDLTRRQQQYADRSWTPPAQGGERRAGDEDASAG